jgi:hypothetical protein
MQSKEISLRTTIFMTCSLLALAACGGTSTTVTTSGPKTPVPAAGDIALSADGKNYVVTDGAKTVTVPVLATKFNGQPAWIASGATRAAGYTDSAGKIVAIGGVDNGVGFRGVNGLADAAPTGNATFTGRYSVVKSTGAGFNGGPLTLSYNLSGNSITNVGGNLTVSGTVSPTDSAISGSVIYNGDSATLEGGFSGDNVAGAFSSNDIGGVIYGSK